MNQHPRPAANPAPADPVPPADNHWHQTTAQARAHFDHDHANTPMQQWTADDFEAWINLHLAA